MGFLGLWEGKKTGPKIKLVFLCVWWTTEVGERLNPHAQQISPGGTSDTHTHTHRHTHKSEETLKN